MLWHLVIKGPSPGLGIASKQAWHADGLVAIVPAKCDASAQRKNSVNLKQEVVHHPSQRRQPVNSVLHSMGEPTMHALQSENIKRRKKKSGGACHVREHHMLPRLRQSRECSARGC